MQLRFIRRLNRKKKIEMIKYSQTTVLKVKLNYIAAPFLLSFGLSIPPLLHFTLIYLPLLYFTSLYFSLLHFTFLHFTLCCVVLECVVFYFEVFYFLVFTFKCFILQCFIWLCKGGRLPPFSHFPLQDILLVIIPIIFTVKILLT